MDLSYILNELGEEREIAYVVMDKVFGKQGAIIFSGFLFLGVLAYVNGLLMSNPRVMYAMGEDRSLPAVFAKKDKKTEVLTFSLTIFAATCVIILFFMQQFEKILAFTIFLDCFGMILSSASIFWFRKKTKHLDGTGIYKMKLFPLFPLIFIAAYSFVGVSIALDYKNNDYAALTGLGVLIVFIILYFLFNRKQRIKNNTEL